jgi:hypothetical protein
MMIEQEGRSPVDVDSFVKDRHLQIRLRRRRVRVSIHHSIFKP